MRQQVEAAVRFGRLTGLHGVQVWAWGLLFASLRAKRRLYSGGTGQERLRAQLKSAGRVKSLLEAVKLAWPGERVPAGALEALHRHLRHQRQQGPRRSS
jgi:hypothetical protein